MANSRRSLLFVGVVLPFAIACGGSQSPPPTPSPTTEAAHHLEGTWRLTSFTPETPLEAPYQQLVDAQLTAMTIAFSDGTFSASGPGVNTSGRYEITSALSEQFSGTLYDSASAPYPISGRFQGNRLEFVSRNERWRGSGVLERVK